MLLSLSMLVTNLPELVEYLKTAPKCDGVNHDWIHDDEVDGPDEEHCAGCYVIRGTENEVE